MAGLLHLQPDRRHRFSEAASDGGKTRTVNYDFICKRKAS